MLDFGELGEGLTCGPLKAGAIADEADEIDEAGRMVEQVNIAFGLLDTVGLKTVVDQGLDQGLFNRTDRVELLTIEPGDCLLEFAIGGFVHRLAGLGSGWSALV